MKKLFPFLLVSIILMGCGPQKELENRVRQAFNDPESVQFRNLTLHKSCLSGEVNAKNKTGGYSDFIQFYVSDSELILGDTHDKSM